MPTGGRLYWRPLQGIELKGAAGGGDGVRFEMSGFLRISTTHRCSLAKQESTDVSCRVVFFSSAWRRVGLSK